MSFQWDRVPLTLPSGETVQASAPVILSASRSTDVPAFHAEWFMRRLEAGYLAWVNPFNRQPHYVSLAKARAIVFWSKNPRPLLQHLDAIDARGLAYYFQFTLNDYQREGLEPRVAPLARRLDTFRELSARLGKERVVWRYDPLMLAPGLTVDDLLGRIEQIGDQLAPHTDKLVFSFVDVAHYKKVQNNLVRETQLFDRSNVLQAELNNPQRLALVSGLAALHRRWRAVNPAFELSTCAEEMALEDHGVTHNKCIDDALLLRIAPHDQALSRFLGVEPQPSLFGSPKAARSLKDTGQRAACGCVYSKDIGAYNTCGHLCAYCYANTSAQTVLDNLRRRDAEAEGILPSSS
ncbi:MAG: DUF1848 domain-containing protein [Deltaproteobacteria bacterium]|nr:DUF1848 domain-containing protein [Deltaproteobacteria bacterium]